MRAVCKHITSLFSRERRSNALYAVEEANVAFYKAFEEGDIEVCVVCVVCAYA